MKIILIGNAVILSKKSRTDIEIVLCFRSKRLYIGLEPIRISIFMIPFQSFYHNNQTNHFNKDNSNSNLNLFKTFNP